MEIGSLTEILKHASTFLFGACYNQPVDLSLQSYQISHLFLSSPPPCGYGTTRDLIIKMTNYFITSECGVRWYPPN